MSAFSQEILIQTAALIVQEDHHKDTVQQEEEEGLYLMQVRLAR